MGKYVFTTIIVNCKKNRIMKLCNNRKSILIL